jgi:hypothetical protein
VRIERVDLAVAEITYEQIVREFPEIGRRDIQPPWGIQNAHLRGLAGGGG